MNYVRNRTTIPVPEVKETHFDGGDKDEGWVLMELIPGQQLGDAWPTLDEGAKARTTTELKFYLEQLRRIRASGPGWIGSCSGGPAYDHRLDNITTCGPFASIAQFHDFLVAPVKNCPRTDVAAEYRARLSDEFDIVFAHADISWENILVDPATGAVTGVVDWEMAGFWPEWWEFRKALYASRSQTWWIDVVKQIMPEYLAETVADMDLEMF